MASDDQEGLFVRAFADPAVVSRYAAEGPRRFLPGLDALHRMTAVLLRERAPANAHVLVLGAGGGLEVKALAQAEPGWTFTGVDPSGEMLRAAQETLGPLASRVTLVQGYIDDAPLDRFDAATCLLTLHFLDAPERTRTVTEIHRRLKTGAPFVAAHSSFPQRPQERHVWWSRFEAYAIAAGADPAHAAMARAANTAASATMFDPEADEAILRAAGFSDASLFYAAFTWRGWIGHA